MRAKVMELVRKMVGELTPNQAVYFDGVTEEDIVAIAANFISKKIIEIP